MTADKARDEPIGGARIEPLLADANRLRARGDLEAAERRCRQALAMAPGNWQAHELLGDIFYQQRRGDEAMEHYRLARAGNPERVVLEQKVGRASLVADEAELTRLRAEGLLRGEREQVPRRPGVAAVLSLVVPGFGQIHNREHIKGVILVCVWLMLVLGAVGAVLGTLARQGGGATAGGQFGLLAAFAMFFSRPTLWWTLLAIGVWLYGIADAALRAAKTMTAPEDLA